jgi:hypothetical protein
MLGHPGMQQLSEAVQMCIQNCLNCHNICLTTITHCLQTGGNQASSNHILILTDCAAMCQTSANFMLRNSSFHPRVCALCADICEVCADECERMANNDRQMQECARVCRQCAESCRHMRA